MSCLTGSQLHLCNDPSLICLLFFGLFTSFIFAFLSVPSLPLSKIYVASVSSCSYVCLVRSQKALLCLCTGPSVICLLWSVNLFTLITVVSTSVSFPPKFVSFVSCNHVCLVENLEVLSILWQSWKGLMREINWLVNVEMHHNQNISNSLTMPCLASILFNINQLKDTVSKNNPKLFQTGEICHGLSKLIRYYYLYWEGTQISTYYKHPCRHCQP